MITHSTSSTLTTDATPAPSAFSARSIMCLASSSSRSSARAQMPLVSRVRSCSRISLNRSVRLPLSASFLACASIAARPA